MVGATASGVTVFCPGCGAALRVAFADGGAALGCHRCGEAVRVPARPHPVETPADLHPVLPAAVARRAARGVRLLQLSLGLFAVEHLLLVGAVAWWVTVAGPAGVANRRWADLGPVIPLLLGLDLGLMLVRAGARTLGYWRCEPAAAAVGALPWVRWAKWAPGLRLVGFVGTFGPWAWGVPFAGLPAFVQALSGLASVVWTTGAVLEFGVLAAWGRLLVALGDHYAAGRAARYVLGVVGGVALIGVGLMMTRLAAFHTARRADPLHRPRLDLLDVQPDALPAFAGLGLVACGVVGVLWLHYFRLLAALRERLR